MISLSEEGSGDCETGNVNTVAHMKFHTDFHVFWLQFLTWCV